jgi:DNA-binding MarR family transcriptional regulator
VGETAPEIRAGGPSFEGDAARRVAELGDLDRDTFAAMFNLFRVSSRLIGYLELQVYRPAGLSSAGFRVLFTVWVFGELEPRRIAALSGVSRAAVSSVLNTLERDGFAERTRESHDRRLVTVRLTAEGERRTVETYRRQNERERELFAALPRSELEQFTRSMRTLLEAPLPPGPAEPETDQAPVESS